jgi:acyl carrier protein
MDESHHVCVASTDDGGAVALAARLAVVRALRHVVPDVDIEEINRFEPLHDEVGLTAGDFARLMAAVARESGIVVPDSDYPSVATMDELEHYLTARLGPTE